MSLDQLTGDALAAEGMVAVGDTIDDEGPIDDEGTMESGLTGADLPQTYLMVSLTTTTRRASTEESAETTRWEIRRLDERAETVRGKLAAQDRHLQSVVELLNVGWHGGQVDQAIGSMSQTHRQIRQNLLDRLRRLEEARAVLVRKHRRLMDLAEDSGLDLIVEPTADG